MQENKPVIRRKPVQSTPAKAPIPEVAKPPIVEDAKEPDPPPEYFPSQPIEEGEERLDLDEQLEQLHLETDEIPNEPILSEDKPPESATTASNNTQKPAKWKAKVGVALTEARHKAGGLAARPFEATKHYSVLRHSQGFVYYQGSATNIAITVFSDQEIPAERTLWLQKRGYSGNTGLKVGAKLGSRSAWIDVTPALKATADALPAEDERAWQRDIKKFVDKARKTKNIKNQRACETDVVRIPHIAEDGYFRIVLCLEKKVLCPSPVFRYMSASTDPSRIRGASLKTLPLELGIKIGAFAAMNTANRVAAPLTSTVQSVVQPYQLGGLTQTAATEAYNVSRASKKVNQTLETAGQHYDEKRTLAHESVSGASSGERSIVGDEDGPAYPYPMKFSGRVVKGSGYSRQKLGVPTATLDNVREDVVLRLSGVYIAWANLLKPKEREKAVLSPGIEEEWHQAIVIVAQDPSLRAKVVEQKFVSVHLIHDFKNAQFFDYKLTAILMGYLRPIDFLSAENETAQLAGDVALTEASLKRSAWTADSTLYRMKAVSASRSLTERLADVRESGQRQFDRVPLHKLGVKTNSMGLKDQLVGNGGICVPR